MGIETQKLVYAFETELSATITHCAMNKKKAPTKRANPSPVDGPRVERIELRTLSGIFVPRATMSIHCAEDYHVRDRACVACSPGQHRMSGDDASGVNTECTAIRAALFH